MDRAFIPGYRALICIAGLVFLVSPGLATRGECGPLKKTDPVHASFFPSIPGLQQNKMPAENAYRKSITLDVFLLEAILDANLKLMKLVEEYARQDHDEPAKDKGSPFSQHVLNQREPTENQTGGQKSVGRPVEDSGLQPWETHALEPWLSMPVAPGYDGYLETDTPLSVWFDVPSGQDDSLRQAFSDQVFMPERNLVGEVKLRSYREECEQELPWFFEKMLQLFQFTMTHKLFVVVVLFLFFLVWRIFRPIP